MTGAAATRWLPIYVGLGANLGDRKRTLRAACADLNAIDATRLVACSRLYETPPLGPPDQPDYLNAVAGLLTRAAPRQLLGALQRIETRHGRRRGDGRWGARTLDLDLLVYADWLVDEPDLTVPHPGLAGRAFVLVPLMELAPALMVPGVGRVQTLARFVDTGSARPAGHPPWRPTGGL